MHSANKHTLTSPSPHPSGPSNEAERQLQAGGRAERREPEAVQREAPDGAARRRGQAGSGPAQGRTAQGAVRGGGHPFGLAEAAREKGPAVPEQAEAFELEWWVMLFSLSVMVEPV